MQPWPDTRDTLLTRLKDPADRRAWDEFALVYEPLIYRVAVRRGLQDADARDVTQRVLWTVARVAEQWAAEKWAQGDSQGRFRGWLAKVTTNAALNLLQRDAKHRAQGGSTAWDILEQEPADDPAVTRIWQHERRLALFRFAAHRAKPKFQPETWNAFWRTAVDGLSGEQVALELNKSVGAVYAARSRVMAQLCRIVDRIDQAESQFTGEWKLEDLGEETSGDG